MFLCYLIVANQYIHLLFPDLFLRANCLYLSNKYLHFSFSRKTIVLQTICNNAIQFRKLLFESDQFPIF